MFSLLFSPSLFFSPYISFSLSLSLLPTLSLYIYNEKPWHYQDFSLLLRALDIYESAAASRGGLQRIFLVITGRGPLRSYYETLLSQRAYTHIQTHLAWLDASDYPLLLGSADLGVCLHASSSGVDLPMKVVDMQGAGLPVLALAYRAIGESVKDGVDGALFGDGEELGRLLVRAGGAGGREWVRELSQGVGRDGVRWEENWEACVGDLFDDE